jgi:hypothetical protein
MWLYARFPGAIRRLVAKYLFPASDDRRVRQATSDRLRQPTSNQQFASFGRWSVDAIMREIDAAAAISDDELRRVFKTTTYEPTTVGPSARGSPLTLPGARSS